MSYCLACVDVLTGCLLLRPLATKLATTVARALFDSFNAIGIPRTLLSDNDTQPLNALIRAVTTQLGVNQRFISAYNPRADGNLERVVRTVKLTIMTLVRGANVFWPLHLPCDQYAY